jgi:hypothetical protein
VSVESGRGRVQENEERMLGRSTGAQASWEKIRVSGSLVDQKQILKYVMERFGSQGIVVIVIMMLLSIRLS